MRSNIVIIGLIVLVLVGCAASPEDRARVANYKADRLPKSTEPLTVFNRFELAPMSLSKGVAADSDKVAVSKQLDERLRTTVMPLLETWQKNAPSSGAARVLLIQPELVSLRVISGGARFWAGAFSGNSSVDMNLVLTDSTTHKVIANVRIYREAGAMAGAWSIGKSDKNLLDYIADIGRQYLVDNHDPVAS